MADEYRPLATLFHMDASTAAPAHLRELTHARLTADSTFRTGIATKLGELFIGMPRELTRQLNDVLARESSIAVLWNGIPRIMKHSYIVHAISEEILSTNDIEGVRSTRKEVQDAVETAQHEAAQTTSNAPRDPYRTVRFEEFARLYLGLTAEHTQLPQTLDDLRTIYDDVVGDEITDDDRPDGELFRNGDVEIIGAGERVVHTGVHSEARINELLTQMLALMKSERIPQLLAAAAAHFLFEYTHPFYDGNGRMGRYLLALNLRAHAHAALRAFAFAYDRRQPAAVLQGVQQRGESTQPWRAHVLRADATRVHRTGADRAHRTVDAAVELFGQAQRALRRPRARTSAVRACAGRRCSRSCRRPSSAVGTACHLMPPRNISTCPNKARAKPWRSSSGLDLITFTKRRPLTFAYTGELPE